jgi:DNA-binding SARP family transcriptional activator
MEFRLLGPLEVVDGERAHALGGRKQRSLLAVLLLNANDVVSAERLVDELWGESPPATANKTIQVYVSRLRKELGEGRLVTREPGYALKLEPDELDLARFRALVAAGSLHEALALWRGPPLADLVYERFAGPHVTALAELRLEALEQRIAADLQLRVDAQLVGELEALVAEHPLRERLRAQLMLALYRSGRQAEALEAYQAARSALVEELGLEPGRELRELQEAILRQDPALDLAPAPARPARTEPRPAAPFVGRARELAELTGALDDVLGGRGRVVVLAGEPGIGKSRLVEELAIRARDAGARVLVGRCWEAGGAPAYWPWVQALRGYVREAGAGELAARLGPAADDLAALLPELAADRAPAASEGDGARFRLFEAVAALLALAAADVPTLVVLDDVHAADEPSLLLLQFVAREIAGAGALLLCAYRDVDPTLGEPLAAALAALVREPHATPLALTGLGAQEVADYVAAVSGAPASPTLAAAIHAETEGNALFVAEVVRLLQAEGRLEEDETALGIPPSVRAVITQRVQRLSEPCRDVVAAGSVLGRELAIDVLARLVDLERVALLDVLDEAIAERLIADVPRAPGRLRFAHALVRDTLYDELRSARRLALHERAGWALEALHAHDLDPYLAEIATHFLAAAPAGETARAADYARRAAERAAAQLAFEEAVRHYESALALTEEPGARCALLLAMGEAHARAGHGQASKATFHAAAELAERRGLPEELARAALGYGGRLLWEVFRDDDRLVPLLERALESIGPQDSALRVRLLARLAAGPLRDARFAPERKRLLSEEALAMARRLGEPATLAYALQGYVIAHHGPEHIHAQLELATELVEIATRAGDHERALEGHEERLDVLIELGDLDAARAELELMEALAAELRQPSQHWLVGIYRALMALLEGRLDDAEAAIVAARELGGGAQSWNAEVTYRLQLYVLRREQGRLAEIEELVRRSADEYATYPIWSCVLAHMEATLGHEEAARRALDALAGHRFAALPVDEEWLISVCLLAEAAATAGAADHAAVLRDLLAPYADRVAIGYPELAIGAVARYLALAEAAAGDPDAAARHLEQAEAINRRIGARGWAQRAVDDRARLSAG